jgi:hypothetical protein
MNNDVLNSILEDIQECCRRIILDNEMLTGSIYNAEEERLKLEHSIGLLCSTYNKTYLDRQITNVQASFISEDHFETTFVLILRWEGSEPKRDTLEMSIEEFCNYFKKHLESILIRYRGEQ